jgi:capsular polysaccharide biosynthesis protein
VVWQVRQKALKLKRSILKRVNRVKAYVTRILAGRRYTLRTVKDYVAQVEKRLPANRSAKILYHGEPAHIGIDHIQDIEAPAAPNRVYVDGYQPYVAALAGVRLVANSSVVYARNSTAINDTLADPEFGQFVDMQNDLTILSHQYREITVKLPKASATVDRAFHLSGLFANHFGHWYAEYLPRLRHFEQVDDFASIPILVNSNMPPSHLEMLKYFCDNPVIPIKDNECIKVKELLVAPTITFCPPKFFPDHPIPFERQGAWSAEAMHYMRRKILANVPQVVPQTKAIYLSRKNSTWGIVSNEDEVEDCLLELGFEILQPERLTFSEQVAILRSCHTIVGATGSALNSLMLAQINTNMLLLAQAEGHNWGGWAGPMRDLGFDPKFLLMQSGSRTAKHMPITVEIERLRRIVTQLLERQ